VERDRYSLGWPAWVLVASILVLLPAANAHLGFPYVTSRLPGEESSWTTHRIVHITVHALLVLLVSLWARGRKFSLQLAPNAAAGLTSLAAVTLVTAYVVLQKPLEAQVELLDYGSYSRSAQLLSVTAIIWAGLGQEILFRAFALPVVEELTGSTVAAVLMTGAAFGYYHGATSLGVLNLGANIAGGALLGALFALTRNTWAVAIPHAALVAVLLALA
jgi:membrane protease YdiL (CAAX protease family)